MTRAATASSSRPRPIIRRLGALTLAVAVSCVAAACTGDAGVTGRDANQPAATAAPASTVAPAPIDGSTPVTAPDPNGLPPIGEADPEVVVGELDNGLRYMIRENDNPGARVEMRLVVDAGSVLEADDQDGGAHFLEHMLFNGTEEFPENELIAVLRSFGAAFGADVNAYTSYDETVYQLTMPTDDADIVATGLDVLAQWLSAATIDQDQVEAERGVVLDEWRVRESSTSGRVFDELEALFLAGSPYEGRDPIGAREAIETTDAAPLRRFYDDWYRPDNATIIVVGDIDAEQIEDAVVDRFTPAVARGESPPRPTFTVASSTRPQARVLADPDVAEGFSAVALPLGSRTSAGSVEADAQRDLLDRLAFDIVATRLANDALRGEAPFDDARVDSSGFVRGLDAPEIVVSADGGDLEAATQAVFDEYERVRRFGFSASEVDRAVSSVRSSAQSQFDARDSRQDAAFAEEYVGHVLDGEPIPTARAGFDFVNAVLDRATPETVAFGFVERLATAGPHVLVVVPEREVDVAPTAETIIEQAESLRDRSLEPRPAEAAIGDELMPAPEPVEEIARETLADGGVVSFIAPEVLTFPNGVRVSINPTQIVEGQVLFEARSAGGLALVADGDVAAADAAGAVVGSSGVAVYDSVALDAFLADKDVSLSVGIDVFDDRMGGSSSTGDLETLMQLIHLTITQPRVDPVALELYLDDELPFANDPSIDPGYAEFEAMLRARYDDPRWLLPTVESLNSVTADGVARVFDERFADASGFVFAFSGDVDVDTLSDLARRYLGTLPSAGRTENVDRDEPPPPAGIVNDQVRAGDGEQANVSLLYTAPGSTDRRDDVLAAMVQEVVTNRLTDAIREELGESYSPFAVTQLTGGARPNVETYLANSTGADLLDEVAAAVQAQLTDLRTSGPTAAEFEAAAETLRQQLDLFSNEQINAEVLNHLVDPAGNPSFDDFLDQAGLVDTIGARDVTAAIGRWLPADQYIEIRVVPR